ncbi:MAG: hypothetical protein L3J17_04620 [Candidatus Jettenia sp.]|nr:MAG: hypothetical protein L3J17_04620 [Candidatus Jettenia sp.]
MGKKKRLLDEYRFPGFRPKAEIKGIFGDAKARIIRLFGLKKRCAVVVVHHTGAITARRCSGYETYLAERCVFTWRWRFGVSSVGDGGR